MAGGRVLPDRVETASGEAGVVAPQGSEEDARAAAVQGAGRYPRVLQAVPGEFEGEALLGVHLGGLARGDAEEPGVEPVHVGEEAAAAGAEPAGCGRVRVVESRGVPPLGGDVGDGVGAGAQQVPVALQVGGAGEAAGQADDGDGFVGRRQGRGFGRRGALRRGGAAFAEGVGEGGDGREVPGHGGAERRPEVLGQPHGEGGQTLGVEA
ncbi:hypothetical protein GCM10017687_09790 [Streptomyces echinatus]